jgi:hypothetical protein
MRAIEAKKKRRSKAARLAGMKFDLVMSAVGVAATVAMRTASTAAGAVAGG